VLDLIRAFKKKENQMRKLEAVFKDFYFLLFAKPLSLKPTWLFHFSLTSLKKLTNHFYLRFRKAFWSISFLFSLYSLQLLKAKNGVEWLLARFSFLFLVLLVVCWLVGEKNMAKKNQKIFLLIYFPWWLNEQISIIHINWRKLISQKKRSLKREMNKE